MDLLNEVLAYLNANQPVLIALGGLAGVLAQYGINRFKCLSKAANYVLGLGVLPIVSTILLSLGTSVSPEVYPWVVVAGQAVYAFYEWLKRNAVSGATVKVPGVVNGELQA